MKLIATIPEAAMLTWESQAEQYSPRATPGIHRLTITEAHSEMREALAGGRTIDCLLFYDEQGVLRGILNRYPQGVPHFEAPGNINLWVDPSCRRRGIGSRLLQAAEARFGVIDFDRQRYSPSGVKLVAAYLARR